MNECIIYYDGVNHYNNPVFLTKKILKTILLAYETTEKFFNLNWY